MNSNGDSLLLLVIQSEKHLEHHHDVRHGNERLIEVFGSFQALGVDELSRNGVNLTFKRTSSKI
jgi:hypothetical protein